MLRLKQNYGDKSPLRFILSDIDSMTEKERERITVLKLPSGYKFISDGLVKSVNKKKETEIISFLKEIKAL